MTWTVRTLVLMAFFVSNQGMERWIFVQFGAFNPNAFCVFALRPHPHPQLSLPVKISSVDHAWQHLENQGIHLKYWSSVDFYQWASAWQTNYSFAFKSSAHTLQSNIHQWQAEQLTHTAHWAEQHGRAKKLSHCTMELSHCTLQNWAQSRGHGLGGQAVSRGWLAGQGSALENTTSS